MSLISFRLATLVFLSLGLLFTVASSLAEDVPGEIAPATVAERLQSQPPSSNLHQWGAVTLFHGLPSDRVRAIAQGADGAMWFGTDAGLARYDGRRTQTVAEAGLAARRVFALEFDDAGRLWVGTDAGAFVRRGGESGEFTRVAETEGKSVTAIAVDEGRAVRNESAKEDTRVVMATNAGVIFDCRARADGATFDVRRIEDHLLLGVSGADARAPLELTSLTIVGETVFVGTRGRGLLAVERDGAVREVYSRPRSFFVEAVARDARGDVWLGAQTTAGDSGLYASAWGSGDGNRRERGSNSNGQEAAGAATRARTNDGGGGVESNLPPLSKVLAGGTGTVSALRFDARGDLYAGTDGAGVFRYRGRERSQRFTFEATAGGLRSNHVYAIFVDREGVVWFGTDRGVCRYDPRGLRNESVSEEAEGNFVRVLYRTTRGRVLAGTNRGLFVRANSDEGGAGASSWRRVAGLEEEVVYAVVEDARRGGLLLVGTARGLFVGVQAERESKPEFAPRADDEKKDGGARGGEISPEKKLDQNDERSSPDGRRVRDEPAMSGDVRAVAFFRGAIYVAVYGRGLERVEAVEGRLQRSTATVWPRVEGEKGEGDTRAKESVSHHKDFVSLHADEARGRLWIGTAGAGVFYFDGREVRREPALESLNASAVRAIEGAGRDGSLWLATGRGLYLFRAGSLVEVAPGFDARAVVPITTEDEGDEEKRTASANLRAWCATVGGGLLKISLDDTFGAIVARLDAEQGLSSQSVFAVLPVAARSGRREEGGDGAGETLFVGTSRGVARYEPGREPPALHATRVTGARAHAPEELRAGAGGVVLEYPQNSLVLDVAATSSRTFPQQFQYAFLLFDGTGAIVQRKLAHDSQFQIENLQPGAYRVEARAFNVDLVSSLPLAFDLRVGRAPFPWTTAALSVLLVSALVALAWGAIQNARLSRAGRALLDANSQLASARLRLANETEAERRRIARDLHDQTLADLRRLILMADEMKADETNANGNAVAALTALTETGARATINNSEDVRLQPDDSARRSEANSSASTASLSSTSFDPAVLRAEIESISQEVRRICEDLSPSVLENVGFTAALEWALADAVAHLPADCKFAYEFDCADGLEERLHFSRGVQMQIYRVVQEAVSNVCRHAGASRVRLAVGVSEENDFMLTLEDDGRGFEEGRRQKVKGKNGEGGKELKTGRGVANIRARAAIVDAEVHWDGRPEGGTIFTLRIAGGATESSGTAATNISPRV